MKILVAHPGMGTGGSEAVAMAALEALQRRFDLSFLTLGAVDWEALNRTFLTQVEAGRVTLLNHRVPQLYSAGAALRGAYLNKLARAAAADFDLCVSSYNFVDFGKPAIQLVADLSWHDELRNRLTPRAPGSRSLLHDAGPLRSLYLGLAGMLAGTANRAGPATGDIVLANSAWTAALLRQHCAIDAEVLYPPVALPPSHPETERSGDFVSLGRISPEKRVLESIGLLAKVRAAGFDFRYHIIGPVGDDLYGLAVRKAASDAGSWVRLAGGLHGDEKFAELRRHSYGIHLRPEEAFGIAVAEMGASGIVPFVLAGSAPAEIVECPEACFADEADAVGKIAALLSDPALERTARVEIEANSRRFGKRAFQDGLLRAVDAALAHA